VRVLGIAGSPRRDGNTDLLLREVMRGVASRGGEIKTLFLRDLNIAPCEHCDVCLETGRCKIMDDMQMVYEEVSRADRLVLASPLHFLGLSAQTKTMVDRFQALWAQKYRICKPALAKKRTRKGLFVSVGARKTSNLFAPALATVKALFAVLDIKYAGDLLFEGVDEKGAILNNLVAMGQAFIAGQQIIEEQPAL
jgi:multimeric flavodoxin WrbA